MALSTTAIGYQIAGLKVMADLLAAKSSHPNRQRMPEHIPRVPPRLDPLQARVVPGPEHIRRALAHIVLQRELPAPAADQGAVGPAGCVPACVVDSGGMISQQGDPP